MNCSCRACHAALTGKELLIYRNMPKSAQHFPTKENLTRDSGIDILLKECLYCGLVQAVGEPVPYYRDVIRAVGVSEEMSQFRLKQFYNWAESHQLHGKKVIEVGSGDGQYLMLAEKAGLDIVGLENSPKAVCAAVEKGHRMLTGFIEHENTSVEGGPYDAFMCLSFLEHIPDPGAFLRGIAYNLANDAYGLVEVPNFDMILKKSLYSEFIQDHLSYFTAESLRNLLSFNGFEVLSIKEIWHGYILSADVRKKRPTNVQGMLKLQAQLRTEVLDYLKDCQEKGIKVAAWGAGHQALANMSLLDMSAYLECVIDSAVFKQNKFTPATHIPVVGPEVLDDGMIGSVIIMAAGYSQEIIKILDTKYPGIQIAVLGDTFQIIAKPMIKGRDT